MTELRTQRLVLRPWRDDDHEPFAALNADREVMRHFPATLTREASDSLLERASALMNDQGWGLWAAEVVGGPPFIGFIGLAMTTFPAPFAPALEVGWRLAREHWGYGYAPEGGEAALRFAFEDLAQNEVVSFTAVANTNSRRVMEKLGLTHDPSGDFDHPNIEADSPVRRHVLYRIDAKTWRAQPQSPSNTE